jgi:hypothetical protein
MSRLRYVRLLATRPNVIYLPCAALCLDTGRIYNAEDDPTNACAALAGRMTLFPTVELPSATAHIAKSFLYVYKVSMDVT